MGMASIAVMSDDLPRAAALLREALAAHARAPDYMFLAWTVGVTAAYAAAAGNLRAAARLLGADRSLRRHGGAVIPLESAYPQVYAQIVAAARSTLGDAEYGSLVDQGDRVDVDGAIALAEQAVTAEPPGRPAERETERETERTGAVRPPALRVVSL